MHWQFVVGLVILADDVEVSDLALHGVGVNLTHVIAAIGFSDVLNVQIPGPVLGVGDRNPVVLGDHVTVNGQYCLRVHPLPGDLQNRYHFFIIT